MFRDYDGKMSEENLQGFIARHKMLVPRLKRLRAYYLGEHQSILEKPLREQGVEPNRIINPYPAYIVDTLTGYFLGTPISYSFPDEGTEAVFSKILEMNHESSHNIALAKDAAICGLAYEVLYYGKDGGVHFKRLPPEETFLVYDHTLEDEPLYGVRYYDETTEEGEKRQVIYLYDAQTVRLFYCQGDSTHLVEETPHAFGMVPVLCYHNNLEGKGDFERVLSLIDAYDRMASNTLDDMDSFSDAYLYLRNLAGTTDEDIRAMRRDRVISVTDGGEASFLVKHVNDSWIENYKNRLSDDIHKFSYTPNLSDANFAGNNSGVAIRYKLMGMEQVRKNKERHFKKSLYDRLQCIANHTSTLKGAGFSIYDIKMTFNNSLPQNLLEISQVITNLKGSVSEESLLALLPFIDDPAHELEQKAQEEESTSLYEELNHGTREP